MQIWDKPTNDDVVIDYSDGRFTTLHNSSVADAQQTLRDEYGDGVVFCDEWYQAGYNIEDQLLEGMLVWLSEDAAENDTGERAIAEIIRVDQYAITCRRRYDAAMGICDDAA